MKLIKNAAITLFLAFTLSSCEENGPILTEVKDEFGTSIKVTGLDTATSFSVTSSTDINDLLTKINDFIEADIEKVTFTLQDDYSGSSISGTFQILVESAGINISETITLQKGVGVEVVVPENSGNILSLINSGLFGYVFKGDLSSPAGDDDFSIRLDFQIRATGEI